MSFRVLFYIQLNLIQFSQVTQAEHNLAAVKLLAYFCFVDSLKKSTGTNLTKKIGHSVICTYEVHT